MKVADAFAQAATAWPANPFLCTLPETAAIYGIPAGEITYAQAAARIARLAAAYREAGWGAGHRIGLLLENRPDFILHWFALNACGASVVPINPDLRAAELAYLIAHSEMALAIAWPGMGDRLAGLPVISPNDAPPPAPPATGDGEECALLYTSGTTGLPKGCILSQDYFHEAGAWYHAMGGLCTLRPGVERMLTPLPMFHMNAMAVSTMAMVLGGGCLILLDRFHPSSFWDSVHTSRATCLHYLGVMPAILMAAPPHPLERAHHIRFGFGAGVEKSLHAPAEARFGFPLVEGWAMTETGAGGTIQQHKEPRLVGAGCLGRADGDVQARILRDDGREAAPDEPGELLVRRAGPDPRRGYFSGYLKDPEATAEGWAGGWWHSGDLVRRDAEGRLFFVDRKKNIIRRSGENIAAIEVEATLLRHPGVKAAAVTAVPDPIRGDEVFALLIPHETPPDPAAFAREIVAWCLTQLAYYKAPGYVALADTLPLTGTNKVQRGVLKSLAAELATAPATIDTRDMKKRGA